MFNLVYLLLAQKLNSLQTATATPLLRQVDRYRGQYELNATENQMQSLPACLVEFNQADMSSIAGGGQLIRMPLTLHIISMASTAPGQLVAAQPHNGTSHEGIVEQVYLTMQNHRATAKDLPALSSLPDAENFQVFNTLNRTAYTQSFDYLPLLVTQLSFETLAYDPAAVKHYQKVQAILKATVSSR